MLFIINPTASRGRTARDWPGVRKEMQRLGLVFSEQFTTRPAEASEITRQALISGEKTIVAVGGDGTLNEVINGYFDDDGLALHAEAAVGLLPSGTGSDFRRSIKLATLDDAINALKSGNTQMFDVIRVELRYPDGSPLRRYSINVVSFGLGGDTVGLVNSWRDTWPSWVGGRVRFIAAALKSLDRYQNRRVRVLLDGEWELTIETNFIVAANARFAGGGMMLAPHAELNDGMMDIVMADAATRWDIVRELPRIHRGAHLTNPKVSETRARRMAISSDVRLAVDIDGEPAGHTPANLTVLPSAVRFVVGNRF